jgi:hypothetical protein
MKFWLLAYGAIMRKRNTIWKRILNKRGVKVRVVFNWFWTKDKKGEALVNTKLIFQFP